MCILANMIRPLVEINAPEVVEAMMACYLIETTVPRSTNAAGVPTALAVALQRMLALRCTVSLYGGA
jgi:hypothetical protein